MSFTPQLYKTYALIGSRGSGKTTICKTLMNEKTELGEGIDSWLVFSNGISLHQYEFLEFKQSPHRLFPTLDLEALENAFQINEKRKKKNKTLVRFGMVFDDCLDKTSGNIPIIQKIFTQGRHFKFSILYLTQSVSMGLPPTVRRNVDVFFVLKPRMRKDIEFYWEELLSGEYSKKESAELFSSLAPYQCLIISFQDRGKLELFKYKPMSGRGKPPQQPPPKSK